MSQGWFSMSPEHKLAQQGVKTAKIPDHIRKGTGSQLLRKEKVNNHLQNVMHDCDKKIRKVCNTENRERALQTLSEAEDAYSKLSVAMQTFHNECNGDPPHWIGLTWMQSGEFKGNGKVKRAMDRLKSASDAEFDSYQKQLFNAIKLGTEQTR